MKFSVIIPMYNAGRYIETCLASVFAREGDFEVIVVDDGSDDGSAALVREKFPQVRLFEKAHAGQGAARNFGLQQAAGDYVWFVDADDTIAPEAFERLAEAAGEGPDIIALAAANLGEDGPVRRFSWKGMRPCPGREVILQGKLQRGTPFSVYRREFLRSRSLCFPEGICHEDAVFTPMAWYQAERVQFIDELLYFVFLSPNSTTRSANPKRAFDSIAVAQPMLSRFADTVDPACRRAFDSLLASDLNHALKNSFSFDAQTHAALNRCVYDNRRLFRHLKGAREWKFRLEYCFFRLFPHRTVQVYQFLEKFNPSSSSCGGRA